MRDYQVHLKANQLGGELRQTVVVPLGPPVLNREVLTFDIA
jgi:hypothetical protein